MEKIGFVCPRCGSGNIHPQTTSEKKCAFKCDDCGHMMSSPQDHIDETMKKLGNHGKN